MRVCSVEGCELEFHARGLCTLHYHRAKRARSLPDALEVRPWSDDDIAELRHMFAFGCDDETIAAALGRTAAAIRRYRAKLRELRPASGQAVDARSWSAWLPMRARMVALEERDAARDARDAERFSVTLTERGLVVRERAEAAA